jgi:hypothetical protein
MEEYIEVFVDGFFGAGIVIQTAQRGCRIPLIILLAL